MKRCLSAVHGHTQEQYVQIKHLDAVYIVAKKQYIMKIVQYTAFFCLSTVCQEKCRIYSLLTLAETVHKMKNCAIQLNLLNKYSTGKKSADIQLNFLNKYSTEKKSAAIQLTLLNSDSIGKRDADKLSISIIITIIHPKVQQMK